MKNLIGKFGGIFRSLPSCLTCSLATQILLLSVWVV